MAKDFNGTGIADFNAVRLVVASADDILSWSYGEVTKPETINYRTQKPERDGLFCERIFGPVKDINPHDVKLKGVRSREAAVDKNGELVTKSIVRRERMGHISLASPVAHIWFMRGTPSAMALLLGLTVRSLERIAYFASYVILEADETARQKALSDAEAEYEAAKAAVRQRFEKQASGEGADIKALAAEQTQELEELAADYQQKRSQLDAMQVCSLLGETEYRNLPPEYQSIVKVGMGGEALYALLKKINLKQLIDDLNQEAETAKGQRKKKLIKRLKVLEGMQRAGIKPESMCVSVLPVIPPDLRPMVQLTGGRFATSDLNDLYRRVINRNNRLKKLIELNAPEVIRRNEMRMLQEAVDALIDNSAARGGRAVSATGGRRRLKSLSDMLKGKQGRFRQNLLGKRVDYSGRSVIVAGPDLKINQCGLPKAMALELFKPFVIAYLLEHEYAHNIRSATRLIDAGETVVYDALDEVIRDKYVLLNRAPTLHRLGIQAFQPKLIEGKAIQLHPLVTTGFNADFDGDQMAVHLPLSDQAQVEAKELMSATKNLLKPSDGSPILNLTQDIVLGCYYLTYLKPSAQEDVKQPKTYSSVSEAIHAFDRGLLKLQTPLILPVKRELRQTTLGRVFFNEVLPDDFPYIEDVMNKKRLSAVMRRIFETYGQEQTGAIVDEIKNLAFEYATAAAISTAVSDYFDVEEIGGIIEEADRRAKQIFDQYEQGLVTDDERYALTIETWRSVDSKVMELLDVRLKQEDTSIAVMVDSGARGSLANIKLAAAYIGVMVDASGKEIELPIRSSFKKGLTPLEAFAATRGSRKGLIDTALKTADSGYLTRRLVDVSQDVFTVKDDAEDPGFNILREETATTMIDFKDRLSGRYCAEDVPGHVKRGELITQQIAEAIEADETIDGVKIMSVLSCHNLRGVPQKSYGIDMATGRLIDPAQPIGVIAAQSVGEPGTQLTLNTFHSSGVAGDDITQGLPRVDELFEARAPKGQAYLAETDGDVRVWEDGEHYVIQIIPASGRSEKIPVEDRLIRVKSGTQVRGGDVLASFKDESQPLIAPFDGEVEVGEGEIVITASSAAPLRYEIPGFKNLTVSDGDKVAAGDRLTNGSINLHDLMRLKGIEATQRYIINEVLRIYAAQAQYISGKHLEVIVRQMFSRVQIEDPGDSSFVTGDIVSKASVVEANHDLTSKGRKPAQYTQLLLGITKVSIWSDSFLSAASFQDTTRVLINAAISGRVDKLYGLKENVIIGRKIPVGTGAEDPTD